MKDNTLFDPVSYFEFENEHIKFNHLNISNRDAAFLCYYFIQDGNAQQVAPCIDRIADDIRKGSMEYADEVLWLWLLGEYANKEKGSIKPEDFKKIINTVTDHIELHWQRPAINWMEGQEEGIYLANLAMAYGALKSVNNAVKDETAQQLMIKIREFMFKKFLKGGKVAGKLGDDGIMGDISLISVPFGLLDAGNQILVETMKDVEKELVSKGVRLSKNDTYFGGCTRNDLTCLLSWYYSERGEIGRAKWLLEQVEAVWQRDGKLLELDLDSRKEELYYKYWCEKYGDSCLEKPFSYIIYAIARQNIVLKEQLYHSSDTGVQIIHSAAGTGNPYLFSVSERYPRYPEEDENVFLRAVTQPFREEQAVCAVYSINGGILKKTDMKIKTSTEGEKFWEADIGSFCCGDKVTYRFEVSEGLESVKSDTYCFVVRKWHTLSKLAGVSESENELSLYFERAGSNQGIPCLKISKSNEDTLKWSFSFENDVSYENKGKEPHHLSGMECGGDKLEINRLDTSFCLSDHLNNVILESCHKTGNGFIDLLTDGSSRAFKIRFNFSMNSGERVFGLGERYSHMEYSGQDIDNYVYNQYRDQGLRTYIPVPFMLSSRGYGIYLDTALYSRFRFGTRLPDLMEIEVNLDSGSQSLDMYLFTGIPEQILQRYSNITGKAKLPPKWAFGPWMSSNNWDSQAEVNKQIALTKKHEIPSTVIVLEQWSDEATYYIFNDAQYETKDGNSYFEYEDFTFPEWGRWPDPKKMVEELHAEGLKVLLWQVPAMKYMDGIAHAQKDEDERAMLENGYHVKYKNGEAYRIPYFEWFKRSLVPDFTNPGAKEWWVNKRLYLLQDIGIDGFKTDGGECIYGEDLLFFDGSTGDAMRNHYPNLYIGSYYEFVKRHTNGDGITFSRAGYAGAQKSPLHWAGDERSTFKAFTASVKAGLSCSMSGIPFWGWDLAGFNGEIPTAELYVRAAQMAAFCPVMQYHAETKGEYNRDRTPWNIAERTGEARVIDIYKMYADLRMNLLPYIYQQAVMTSENGIPMMRAMFLEYPADSSCIGLSQQYMFGDSLLVAPVMEEGSSIKDVYLPEGKWMNLFNGKVTLGPQYVRLKAGLDEIPVFIKENSVIPLNLSDDFGLFSHVSNELDKYRNLCFMIFATGSIQYKFTDDLGYEVNLGIKRTGESFLIEIESNYNPIALIFKNLVGKIRVEADGKPIPEAEAICGVRNNSYAVKDDCLIIKADCHDKRISIYVET